MTRSQHLAWCKRRALAELKSGGAADAIASMLSDLNKHPETAIEPRSPLTMLGMMAAMSGSEAEASRFIEGFN